MSALTAARPCAHTAHPRRSIEAAWVEPIVSATQQPVQYFLDQIRGAAAQVEITPGGTHIVFLATCRSGVRDHRLLISAVEAFRFFHPRCLIGTLADVPDLAASEFCGAFYGEVSKGSSVGAALLEGRVHLLEKLQNPFGVLFSSYCGEDTHVLLREDRREKYLPRESAYG